MIGLTPSQTIGPFFHHGLAWAAELAGNVSSDSLEVTGRVLDFDGNPVADALLEIWQPALTTADGAFQRVASGVDGGFLFRMRPPAKHACYANVTVFARGLLRELYTRVYLYPDSDLARAALPASVPAERAATLIAAHSGERYRWDIRLRGEGETVFFEIG
jgi:protocatechuate 3,4-dioxygenase, alpha subunit